MHRIVAALLVACLLPVGSAWAIDPHSTQQTNSHAPASTPPPRPSQAPNRGILGRPIQGMWLIAFSDSASSPGSGVAVFADQTSVIVMPNGYRRMWSTWVSETPLPYGGAYAKYHLTFIEYDCTERRSRFLQSTNYGADGSSLGSERGADTFSYATPGTVGESALAFACTANFSDWIDPLNGILIPVDTDPSTYADAQIFHAQTTPQNQTCDRAMRDAIARGTAYVDALAAYNRCTGISSK